MLSIDLSFSPEGIQLRDTAPKQLGSLLAVDARRKGAQQRPVQPGLYLAAVVGDGQHPQPLAAVDPQLVANAVGEEGARVVVFLPAIGRAWSSRPKYRTPNCQLRQVV